jgi:hypothetical protein
VKLTRVTITGADDAVDPAALYALSREFGFVEWGILRSNSREGTARFPSSGWRQRFAVPLVGWRPQTALHLCGEAAREAIAGNDEWPDLWHYDRVQLNGFSRFRLPFVRCARSWKRIEVILQTSDLASELHAIELEKLDPNIVHLLDASGGRGQVAVWAERPELRLGYAGGIGPDNVVQQIEHLLSYRTEQEFWIDMESGIRTSDRFDLAKVRRVLELAKPFVEAA